MKQALSSVDGLCPFPLRLAHPSSLPPFFFHIGIGLQLVALLYISKYANVYRGHCLTVVEREAAHLGRAEVKMNSDV